MKNLGAFYNRFVPGWVAVLIIAFVLFENYIKTNLPANIVDLINKWALSTSTMGLLFIAGEYLIRKKLWRLPLVWRGIDYNPYSKLDFAGRWRGETFYLVKEQDTNGTRQEITPYSGVHDVKISQDCLNIQIENTSGDAFPTWGSIAATVSDDGILRFLYRVEYAPGKGFPARIHGYEWLAPKLFSHGDSGQPIAIHGNFGHCAGEARPIFSGETLFIREGYLKKIKPSEIPERFRTGILARSMRS
ncbi:MAG: hypothetical protein P4M13_00325 [Alphaproteobacteria bacterium]|nr:hypothetical protein [Alphaproteobacteria bacterium]